MIEQAAEGTHSNVKYILNTLSTVSKTSVALDAPCGHGGISKLLKDLGYSVEALDITTPESGATDVNIIIHDLNNPLHYPDSHFDVCISIEGIEHLERPADFFHELIRVLKPGGSLILSTPNPDSFRSRLRYFLKGYNTHFNPVSNTERTSGHIHTIDRIFIERQRIKADLNINKIYTNKQYKNSFIWKLLKGLLTKKLPPVMKDDIVLFGDVLIYHFIKP